MYSLVRIFVLILNSESTIDFFPVQLCCVCCRSRMWISGFQVNGNTAFVVTMCEVFCPFSQIMSIFCDMKRENIRSRRWNKCATTKNVLTKEDKMYSGSLKKEVNFYISIKKKRKKMHGVFLRKLFLKNCKDSGPELGRMSGNITTLSLFMPLCQKNIWKKKYKKTQGIISRRLHTVNVISILYQSTE